MEMRGWRPSVLGGLKQAGLVFAALLVLGGIGWLVAAGPMTRFGSSSGGVLGGVTVGLVVSVLSGPVPPVLACFDISDRTLFALCWALLLPYWCCLGVGAGLIRWKVCASHSGQEQTVPSRQNLKQIRWTIEIAALVLAVCAFPSGPIIGLNRSRSGHSLTNAIINNLRQIDGAKQQLALEKRLSPDYVPTEADLASYLGRDRKGLPPIGPERYVLNPIGKLPYAVLDSDWRIRRRGWREGYTIPKQVIRLE